VSKICLMDEITEGCRLSGRRGLAELLLELLGQEEMGINARWYRLDSFKEMTVAPRNASDPFENPISPLSRHLEFHGIPCLPLA